MRQRIFLSLLLLIPASLSWAVPVQSDLIRSTVSSISGISIDHATGVYYERIGFDGQRNFNVYNSYADFAANNSTGLGLNTNGYYGTYAAVHDGKLFGRSTRQTQAYGRWDLTSGVMDASTTFTEFNPLNAQGTFNWGGFSGMNTIASGDQVYVTGREQGSNDWRVSSIDENLNQTLIGHVSSHPFGNAFIIGDSLFFFDTYNSGQISTHFDLSTGVQSVVDFTVNLPFPQNRTFWTNWTYDPFTDSLIGHEREQRNYFRIANASSVFGVAVPEPATIAALTLGLLVLMRRRRVI